MGALRTSPGTIRWSSGRKLVLGAAVGRSDGRLTALVTLLRSAGLDIVEASDIRKEVWVKLLGNAVFNPHSVVARATMEEMIEDADPRSICIAAMAEAIAVAAASGVALNVTPEERLAMNAHMGPFKSSTLQDFEVGRPPRDRGPSRCTLRDRCTPWHRHAGAGHPGPPRARRIGPAATDGLRALIAPRTRLLRQPTAVVETTSYRLKRQSYRRPSRQTLTSARPR